MAFGDVAVGRILPQRCGYKRKREVNVLPTLSERSAMTPHSSTSVRLSLLAVLTALALPAATSHTAAQPADDSDSTAVLTGRVVSAMTGGPLQDARVLVTGSQRGDFTDAEGRFRIAGLPPGRDTVEVRLLGFARQTAPLELAPDRTTRAVFSLSETVLRIEDIEVTVEQRETTGRLVGFEERRQLGHGAFIGPEDIDDSNAVHSSDLLRTVPGVSVGPYQMGRTSIRITRYQRMCRPYVWLDGLPMGQYDIDNLQPGDLLAIEVYRGAAETPARFKKRGGQCGTMVIWTREGKDGERGG